VIEIDIEGGDEPVLRRAAEAALDAADVRDGHLSIAFVDESEIQRLNREHRRRDAPTDVLSFPIDGPGEVVGPRELGDVVICPERTEDLIEAVVHGVLHLCGYDHETDRGEMLRLQRRVMSRL
jgi:probable rRNA maturation factor